MTTPHRGLPPPPAMSLPSPTQAATGLGPCPPQFQGSEEVYRTWLQAKMEEDRRRAEEERTRQEQYRVETRKADLDFLKESLRAGIPPPLVPIMFAGRGALKGAGRDWLNDFVAQNLGPAMQQHQQQQQYVQQQQQQQHHQQHQQQQQQQQQQQPQQHHHHHHHQPQHTHQVPPVQHSPQAPPLRRATRVIGQQSGGPPHPVHMGPPPAGGMTSQQAAPGLPPPPPPPPPVGYLPPYQVPGGGHPPPPPMQPGPLSRLPKLDTNEQRPAQQPQPPMHSGMPPGQMGGPPHGPPMQPGPPPSQQQPPPQSEAAASQSSPAIYFYHWVPPHSSGVGNATPVQATASPQRQLDSPFTHQPQMNQVTGPEYSHSPKKRKASTQGPPVVSQPFSPSFHATPLPPTSVSTPNRTRRGHSRHRSDTSGPVTRGFEPYSKASRHRRSIGEGSISEGNPPATSSVGDNGGGPHHPHDPHEQQQRSRQQSVPPPSLQRPYSAGAEFRREHYPPPQPQPPPPPESGVVGGNGDGDGRTKSGNGNGRD